MDAFAYRDGTLHVEDVPLERIAAAVGTPVYVYSSATLIARYTRFVEAFTGLPVAVCYALKANSNLAVVRTLARCGAGADVVSGGELAQALAAGVPPARIVFAGVGKTRAELAAALDAGILQINVESEPELDALNAVALERGVRAPVALRVNPNVDALTHAKITTGRSENKFGIDLQQAEALYARAAQMPGIALVGLGVHIGSQLTDLTPYRNAFARVAELAGRLRESGLPIQRIDLGGGLGIAYAEERAPALADYAAVVREALEPLGCGLLFEPGRFLVGPAGVLLTRVLYIKQGAARRFAIVDAAMNDLMRPSLYDAYHPIDPVRAPAADAAPAAVDVVGPICETADTLAKQRLLPPLAADDLLALRQAGAYGAVMASTYNTRPLVPEVLVHGDQFAVIRSRPSYAELLQRDRIPAWLNDQTTVRGAA